MSVGIKLLKEDTYHRIFKHYYASYCGDIRIQDERIWNYTLRHRGVIYYGTSFLRVLDNDAMIKVDENTVDVSTSNDGIRINADVNAAFQIIRKFFQILSLTCKQKFVA